MTGSPTPHLPPPAPVRPSRSLLVGLWLLTAGVLTQATLAGLFLSGQHHARLAHLIVGWLLPYVGIAVAVVAGICQARGTCASRHAIAVYPLPVLLWVQEMLGHLPLPSSTAVHVPLGVVLTVYPAVLAVGIARSRPEGTTADAATRRP